jgi:hypothetical protein
MPTQHKISRLVRRVAHASRNEVIFRGRQLAWNRSEVLRYRFGLGPMTERNWLANPSTSPPGSFYFSSADLPALLSTLRARLPQAVEETIERAERICSHRFDLLGYRDLELGPRINWHLDPVHQKDAPRKAFFKVPYLDFERVGDSKIIWELNRHQHFLTLGKAYQLTGNEKYFLEFVQEFYDWREQNPYLMGINWTSSLEVALRSLSWFWARELFAGPRPFPARLERDVLLALGRNARFIEHNLSTYFSRNTHLLGEAVALFFSGVLCPRLRRAPAWRALGWQIILREAEHQVRSDGAYFEQATYYHIYALDLLLHGRILAARNRIPIPEILDRTLVRMLDYLSALSAAGPTLRFGDDDGGRLFDPRRNRSEHLLDPLSTGAALYRRGDWKSASAGLAEETLWLLGPAGVNDFDALPAEQPRMGSQSFPASGVYSMASDRLRLTVDAGPFGAGNCGHAHADALSINVAANSRECLTDCGTFTYTGSTRWREFFRGTAAHNTLAIDGLDQAEPTGPFKWEKTPEVRVEHWWTGTRFDLLVASHNGYRRLPAPATHRRLVFFVKPRFWLVIDSVEGEGEHQLELFWHMSGVSAKLTGTAFEASQADGEKFGIVTLSDPDWSLDLVETWQSETYGEKRPALALRSFTRTQLPAEFATLLIPRLSVPSGRLERLHGAATSGTTRVFRYSLDSGQHSWLLANGHQTWQVDNIESDARFAYWEQDTEGRPLQVFLWEGSFMSVNRVKIVDLPVRQEHFEKAWPSADRTVDGKPRQEVGALVLGLRERAG